MKRIIEYFLLILLIFSTLLLSACRDDSQEEWYIDTTNEIIEACTGKCLTREEMAQLVYNYEKIQEKYSGDRIGDSDEYVPELKLVTPGEHEHNEKTRYEIKTLKIDKTGIYTGLEVRVMDDTSACKIEDNNQSQAKDDISDEPLEIIKGWWWNDKNEFIFNLENEMRDYPKRFVVEKDGTVHVNRSKKDIMIIRIIDHDHIAIHFTGKSETEEVVLTRGDKPYWAN